MYASFFCFVNQLIASVNFSFISKRKVCNPLFLSFYSPHHFQPRVYLLSRLLHYFVFHFHHFWVHLVLVKNIPPSVTRDPKIAPSSMDCSWKQPAWKHNMAKPRLKTILWDHTVYSDEENLKDFETLIREHPDCIWKRGEGRLRLRFLSRHLCQVR